MINYASILIIRVYNSYHRFQQFHNSSTIFLYINNISRVDIIKIFIKKQKVPLIFIQYFIFDK